MIFVVLLGVGVALVSAVVCGVVGFCVSVRLFELLLGCLCIPVCFGFVLLIGFVWMGCLLCCLRRCAGLT